MNKNYLKNDLENNIIILADLVKLTITKLTELEKDNYELSFDEKYNLSDLLIEILNKLTHIYNIQSYLNIKKFHIYSIDYYKKISDICDKTKYFYNIIDIDVLVEIYDICLYLKDETGRYQLYLKNKLMKI